MIVYLYYSKRFCYQVLSMLLNTKGNSLRLFVSLHLYMQSLYQGFTVSNGLAHELWLLIVSKLCCCFRKRYYRIVYLYYFNRFCYQLLRMILNTKGHALRFFVSLLHSWRMGWLGAARLRTWVMNMCNAHFQITSRLSEPLDGLARGGADPNTISANTVLFRPTDYIFTDLFPQIYFVRCSSNVAKLCVASQK